MSKTNVDKNGVQILARVFHDLIAGKTNPTEKRLIELIHQAVEQKLGQYDQNVFQLAKSALEMAERLTVLEDCVDELVAGSGEEVPGWIH